MKVIPERRRPHLFRYLRFHYYNQVDSSPGGLLVTECIILPLASVSALTWFIRYIYDRNLKFLNNVIMIKTKVLLIQTQVMTFADFGCPVLACLFYSSKNTYIIWLSNISDLSVPDEGCSRNPSSALKLTSTFLYYNI